MKNYIIKLLEKYEDEIMKYTLGDSIDEYGELFTDVYKYEWEDHKKAIADTINNIKKSGNKLNPLGMAYIIIAEWSGVMTFDRNDLHIEGLENVCKNILNDINEKGE